MSLYAANDCSNKEQVVLEVEAVLSQCWEQVFSTFEWVAGEFKGVGPSFIATFL